MPAKVIRIVLAVKLAPLEVRVTWNEEAEASPVWRKPLSVMVTTSVALFRDAPDCVAAFMMLLSQKLVG